MPGETTHFKFLYALGADEVEKFPGEVSAPATKKIDEVLWERLPSRGHAIVPTEQSTESTTYTALATPDEVEIILPENGLLIVYFDAIWKATTATAAAAIFLNGVQVQMPWENVGMSKQEAEMGQANKQMRLTSFAGGLAAQATVTGEASADVTTGQIIGFNGTGSIQMNGEGGLNPNGSGGPCSIFAAAGTYKVSIRYKTLAGKPLTAKGRRLYVEARGF